jgi:alpha-L-fucosidase
MKAIMKGLLPAAMLLTPLAIVQAADPSASGPVHYEPTIESLKQAEVPEWFRDGKLGIFMHWGPESIPGVASTWYARWMYEQGSEGYKYHCATYGHPSKFGYKDICKLFKAPKFDQAQADRLVALYKQAGARYVVPVAAHHDNFDMWDSKYQPRWNSMATAGKDVVGMWQKAAAKAGLHLGVASHVARTFRWFQTSHGSDKTGPLAGMPYDGQNPAFADLYGVPWKNSDPGYEGSQDVGPPEFEKNFEDRMMDLIDRYHPDLYYTDGGPPFKKTGYNIVAHLYNENQKWNGGKLQALATFKGAGIGVENYEFEYADTIKPFVWQTDKTMSPEWYWLRNRTRDYRKGREIVTSLFDIVSKNGNLLLNVPLTPAGELEDATVTMLTDMGRCLDLIGEAVFSTRPWETFGEGPNNFNGIATGCSAADIRFTRNKANTILYVTPLGWPGDGATIHIKTLGTLRINLSDLKSVSLVGSTEHLTYRQDAASLQITLPPKAPYACCAYPIKLTFSGHIPKLKPAARLVWQAQARNISGDEDRSAYGLPTEGGVLLLNVPADSTAAKAGLRGDDVIVACNGQEVRTTDDLQALQNRAAGQKLSLVVIRQHRSVTVALDDYAYFVMESRGTTEFKTIPLAPMSAIVPAKVCAGGAVPRDNPVSALTDGQVVKGFGPIFANGVDSGMYKLDLMSLKSIAQVNTFSSGGRNRARQNYLLYGSNATTDPGWNVADATLFTPVSAVDTRQVEPSEFAATSIRRSDGKPLGRFRWLVWAVFPVNGEIGGENTAFQELQVIPAK